MKTKKLKLLIFVNIISFIGYQLFAPFYSLYAYSIGISASMTGLLWAYYSMLTMVFLLVFGRYENHLNKDKLVVVGFFMYSIGAYLFLFTHSLASLVLVFAFNALATGITLPAYKTIFAKLQEHGRESEEWSWLDAGNMIAISIGSAIGGVAIGLFGFKGIFIVMGTVQLFAACIAYVTLSKKHRKKPFLISSKSLSQLI